MIKLEILVNTIAARQPRKRGDVIEVEPGEANFLIGAGRAKLSTAATPVVIETQQEVKPKRRRGRPKKSEAPAPAEASATIDQTAVTDADPVE